MIQLPATNNSTADFEWRSNHLRSWSNDVRRLTRAQATDAARDDWRLPAPSGCRRA